MSNPNQEAAPAAQSLPQPSLVVGISNPYQSQGDASRYLSCAREDQFDFITTELPSSLEAREDVRTLDSKWWRTSIVGRIPTENVDVSTILEKLPKQVEWAVHMNIPAVLLPPIPSNESFMEYARIVAAISLEVGGATAGASSTTAGGMQLWIPVSLNSISIQQFDAIHQLCNTPANVGMILWMEQSSPAIPPPGVAPPNAATAATSSAAILATQSSLLHQAIGSNLKAVCFPTKAFLTNKRGYPTLAKANQLLFTEILRRLGRTIRVLVEGPPMHNVPDGDNCSAVGKTGCLPYLQYMKHIRKRQDCINALDIPEAVMETPYLDSLQRPLQPLKDHLEFSTYETFEKDPVKYANYREAMYLVLSKKAKIFGLKSYQLGTTTSSNRSSNPFEVTILVAGAGRGPLVTASLEAWQQLLTENMMNPNMKNNMKLKMFAVEKNPSAFVYLQSMVEYEDLWKQHNVQLIMDDLRHLTINKLGGNYVDIVISELLGSFGCNELSPECLNTLFSPSHGNGVCTDETISIPMRYTSHIAPCSSMRLYAEAKNQGYLPSLEAPNHDTVVGYEKALETPYVVRTHAVSQTHLEKNCWTFSHPSAIHDNSKFVHLDFEPNTTMGAGLGNGYGPIDTTIMKIMANAHAQQPQNLLPRSTSVDGNVSSMKATNGPFTVHGFLGTFTADLFNDTSLSTDLDGISAATTNTTKVQISTAPSHFSEKMFSWFPLFFPLHSPLLVPAGATLSFSIWRRVEKSENKVWYEWAARVHRNEELLGVTSIHNLNGRSYYVSM